jgi:hypothetical protein
VESQGLSGSAVVLPCPAGIIRARPGPRVGRVGTQAHRCQQHLGGLAAACTGGRRSSVWALARHRAGLPWLWSVEKRRPTSQALFFESLAAGRERHSRYWGGAHPLDPPGLSDRRTGGSRASSDVPASGTNVGRHPRSGRQDEEWPWSRGGVQRQSRSGVPDCCHRRLCARPGWDDASYGVGRPPTQAQRTGDGTEVVDHGRQCGSESRRGAPTDSHGVLERRPLAQMLPLRTHLTDKELLWSPFPTEDALSALNETSSYTLTTRRPAPAEPASQCKARIASVHSAPPCGGRVNGCCRRIPLLRPGVVVRIPTVYIEVYDRIDSPTLTGRMCRPFASCMLVQWEEQLSLYPDARLVGTLL